eukprot:237148-Chlamydomonas_euryale.AAC.1
MCIRDSTSYPPACLPACTPGRPPGCPSTHLIVHMPLSASRSGNPTIHQPTHVSFNTMHSP